MTLFAGSTGRKSQGFIDDIQRNLFPSLTTSTKLQKLDFSCALTADSGFIECHDYFITVLGRRYTEIELRNIWERYKQDKDFLSTLNGGFVLILADYQQQKLILALDPIGQKSLYYAQTDTGLVFASNADAIIAHPDVSDVISQQSIYDYVYFHHCPSPNSIYKQVKKLEGCQLLTFQRNKISLEYYWQPRFKETLNRTPKDAAVELNTKLLKSVQESVFNIEETGAFLSGGLDSSSVAGALSKAYPGQTKTFTMGFDVDGYDEVEYARMAAEQFQTQAHEYYVTPDDTVNAIPKIAAYYDEPFGNSSALAAYYCAKLAKENGVNILLAGDGGDELFAGNERYTKQLLFEKYYAIPKTLRTALRSGLYNLPEVLLKNKLLFKGKRYVEQAEIILPDRLQDYNFLHRHLAEDIFTDSFIQQVDTDIPLRSLRDSYNRPENANALNRMLYMDWKTTLHDNDLVKVNRMCEMVGVDVAYPLLDKEIVELSCTIPSDLKIKKAQLRWFYKHAMQGFLPEKIINKPKHGFGLPFGIWLKDYQPLKELAYDSINSLKKRPYFKSEFLDHVIIMHQSIHASYYGELIWVLMMLELWFQGKER